MISDAPIKVLHVAETAKGGVGSYIEEVATLQVARYGPEKVRVVMPGQHAALFKSLPLSSLHCFDAKNIGRVRTMLRMTASALRQVNTWQPDVVHLHSTYAGFSLRPLLSVRANRPRVVYCAHGWAFDRDGVSNANGVIARIERLWTKWCDSIVCVSRNDQLSAMRIGIGPDRLTVVLNGIADVPKEAESEDLRNLWPREGVRILFVGRLDRQKGYDILFEAMRQIGDQAFAIVIGDAVVAGGVAIEPPKNVRVAGWVNRDRLSSYYKCASALVMPSRWEGLPLAALEAMRAGCAVIASSVGGLPEAVENGVTGILFDQNERSSQALVEILGSATKEKLETMGAAGRERYVARFNITRVGDELDRLYRRLLSEARK